MGSFGTEREVFEFLVFLSEPRTVGAQSIGSP